MKYLSKLLPVLMALLMTFIAVPAVTQAQQSMDANRLNRDINIMESVLSEIFRYRAIGNNDNERAIMVFEDIYSARSNRNIRGIYLPGYGVIFQVPNPTSHLFLNNNNVSGYAFYYGDSDMDNQEEVTRENVTNRIVEFLMDYGTTIGQLPDDEHVMVIYGGAPRNGISGVFSFSGSRQDTPENQIPVISASVTNANLDAYRAGNLSHSQFRDQVEISETEANRASSKDLRVMSNIFETAFEDNDEGFEIRGSMDYLHLDNFGALFFFEARYGSGSVARAFPVPDMRVNVDSNGQARIQAIEETRQALEERRQEAEQRRAEMQENAAAAFETFKTDLKEYLVDYGRTLSSVENGQHVLLSVTLNSSADEIPKRIDVQVAKAVLERMDQGNMSREQALSQVSIREY